MCLSMRSHWASPKEEQIQELLRDKKVFLIVDEAEVAKQK